MPLRASKFLKELPVEFPLRLGRLSPSQPAFLPKYMIFLIGTPNGLETHANHRKQTIAPISNRDKFAFFQGAFFGRIQNPIATAPSASRPSRRPQDSSAASLSRSVS